MGVIMRGGVPYGNFDRNNLEIITTPLEEVEDKKEDLIYVVKDNIDAAEGEAWCWDGEKAIRIGKAGGGSIELDIDEDIIPLGDGEGNLKNSGIKYFNYIETKTIPGQSATGFPYYFPNETSFYIQDTISFFNGEGGTVNVVEKYTIDEGEAHNFDVSVTQSNSIFTTTINNKTIQIPMSELSSIARTYTFPDLESEVNVTAKEIDNDGIIYYYTTFAFKYFNFEIDAENPPLVLKAEVTKAVATFNSTNPYSYGNSSYVKSNESARQSSLTSIKYKKSGATINTSSSEFKSRAATPSTEEIIADDNMLQAPGDKAFRIKLGESTGAELILKDNMQTVIGGSGVISVKDKCYINIHNDGRTSISNASDLRQNVRGGIYPNNTTNCAIVNILGMPAVMIQDQAAMKIEQDTQILCGGSSIVTMRHNANLNMEGNAYINMQTNCSSGTEHDQSIHKSPYFAMGGGCSFIMQGDRNHNADETNFPAIICEKDRFLFDSRISNGTGNKSGNSFYGPQITSPKYIRDDSERTYMSIEGNTFVRVGAGSYGASYPGKTILTIGGMTNRNPVSNPTTEIYIEGNTLTKISGEAHLEFQDKSKFYNLDESIFVMRNDSLRSGMDLTSETSPKFEMIGKCSIETTSDGITINGVNFTNSQLEALKALL